MKEYIINKITKILNIKEEQIKIEIPSKSSMGDYSIQCANLRNEKYKNPIEISTMIKEKFEDTDFNFSSIKVVGPYINFYINYDKYSKQIIEEIESNKNYGSLNQGNNNSLLIEHTSINPNAEPHIGRCRNSLIGDFMSNLYEFTGYKVERHYFINDIGKKITDKCVKGQLAIFDTLNIHFDVFTHESDFVYDNYLEEILSKLEKTGKLHTDTLGRKYVDLTGYDIPTREPVLVLTRSNGTSLYPIRDIAYSIHKVELNNKNNFVVLGEDQETYMKQISAVLDILGYKAPKLICYSYVLLNGGKMSTSGGTVVLVTDFMKNVKETLLDEFKKRNNEISEEKLNILVNACIKFTMLNVSKNKIVNFNLKNATSFTGESGMYILYSIVRMKSILKNNNIKLSNKIKFNNEIENRIIKELSLFPEQINEILESNEPTHLTKYIFNLTQLFPKFYEEVNISNEEDIVLKSSRIRLLKCLIDVLTKSLKILGIETIDKI